jgi:hypothetical protein
MYFILALHKHDPVVSKVRAIFANPIRDCGEFALRFFDALRASCSDKLRSTIEHLLCFQLTIQICDNESSILICEDPAFLLHVSLGEFSNLSQYIDKFFEITTSNLQTTETQQYFFPSFPNFLFIMLAREVWNGDHMEKDFHRVTFPVMLEMTQYTFCTYPYYVYQLAGVIAHLGDLDQYR